MSSNSTSPTPTPTPTPGTGGGSGNSTGTDPPDLTNNRVTFLVLYGTENQLQAGIPESVGQLDALETFELYNASGTLSTIPTSISRLTNLKLLNLVNVSLSGPIPDSFGNMKRLEHLGLNTNSLSGSVPASIGSLTALKKLYFYENQLTSMPDNLFANMPYLEILAFHRNRFSGKLPSSIGNLKQLEALSIRENKFTGVIPAYFNDMPAMKELYLGDNEFTGIPDPFMPARRMYSLRIDGNKITGALPILPYTNDTCRVDGPDDRNNFVCSRATSASDQLGECYKLSEVRGLPTCTPGQVIPPPVDAEETSSGSFSTGLIAGLVGTAAVAIVAGMFLYHRRSKKPKPAPASGVSGNGGGAVPAGYNVAPTSTTTQPPPVPVAHTGGSSTVGASQTATWTIPTPSAPPTLTPPPGYQTNQMSTASAPSTPAVNPTSATAVYPGALASYNPYSKPPTMSDHQQRPQSFALPSSVMMPQPPTNQQRPQSFASPSTILMPQPAPAQYQPLTHMPQPQLAANGPASPTFAPPNQQQQQPLLYASNPTSPHVAATAAPAHPYHTPLPHVPSAPPMPGPANIASPLLSATDATRIIPGSGAGIELQAVDKDDEVKGVAGNTLDSQVTHVATFDSSTLALPGRPPAVKEEDETLYLG